MPCCPCPLHCIALCPCPCHHSLPLTAALNGQILGRWLRRREGIPAPALNLFCLRSANSVSWSGRCSRS
ncbi:hypothetical protein B0F90DRAFT_1736306 [Multifurca ochricompacta]|uniref:Uncharacterized protein n=1 Tax=Multifurca ochricompacta TaxID=376703 RepID=A0AAD4M1F7_9AGAM|nr:hypothetical protein B0F90DRAFT_1736306 [Multifurca ochricompacta]